MDASTFAVQMEAMLTQGNSVLNSISETFQSRYSEDLLRLKEEERAKEAEAELAKQKAAAEQLSAE